ncbi:MAG: plasmid replication/partition related protein [Burkholderiaceae bacterium]
MNIVVQEDLKTYIDPLTPDEHDALERSLLAEGCRDALVLWGDVLVDGHNRYGLCLKHGLPFNTVQNTRFRSIDDVHLWMIDQHLGRRSVSDFQRGVLALRKKEIVAERQAAAKAAAKDAHLRAEVRGEAQPEAMGPIDGEPAVAAEPLLKSREAVAKAAKLTPSQVTMIEKIQKQAAPELVAAVRAGTISLSAAAAVAGLPMQEQVAAVSAGKDELKLAAKRVRDATKKPRDEASQRPTTEVQALQDKVAQLTAENEYLRGQVAELQARLGA